VFAPFSIALGSVRKKWKRANRDAALRSERLLEASDEAVRHADLWTTYGAESKVRASVAKLGEAIAMSSARLEASAAALTGANEVLGAVALVLTLAAAHAGWLGNTSDALVPFAVAFFLSYRPLRDLTDARLAMARAEMAYDDLCTRVLDVPRYAIAPALNNPAHDPPDHPHRADPWPLATLELRDVELARGKIAPLSLTLPPGKIVAIAGPTGIGKTTLLRTLLGLDAMIAGEIRYDDRSLDHAPPGPRNRPFAWVPQDAPILADTLDANIALGADDANARENLEPFGASHLVDALDGARLGAGGRALSGGERQWVAIARAVATNLPILLLDEPTTGLDDAAQSRVLAAITSLRGERSVLIVTHRPEPLAIADIVVQIAAHASARPIVNADPNRAVASCGGVGTPKNDVFLGQRGASSS
jgi:ABC-type transport system involved in cytochrome bd biosynthesis fused ATPase/permease subunit